MRAAPQDSVAAFRAAACISQGGRSIGNGSGTSLQSGIGVASQAAQVLHAALRSPVVATGAAGTSNLQHMSTADAPVGTAQISPATMESLTAFSTAQPNGNAQRPIVPDSNALVQSSMETPETTQSCRQEAVPTHLQAADQPASRQPQQEAEA